MLWNAFGNLVYLGCQWLLVVLVTNLGEFRQAGVLSLAMSVSATFQTVALFGIRHFQVSDTDGEFSDSAYVGFRFVTCLLSLLCCTAFSLISGYFGETLLAITLFLVFRLAESVSDVLHGIAQKNARLDVAGKSFAIKGVGLLVLFFVTFRVSGNLNAGLAVIALFSLLTTFTYDWLVVRRLSDFKVRPNLRESLTMAGKTLPLCLYLFLFSAISTVPKLILERISGEELLGVYSSIFAPALLITSAANYLYAPFTTAFTGYWHAKDRKRFLALFCKIAGAILLVGVAVLLAAHFFGNFFLSLIFGEKILPYTGLFPWILVAVLCVALMSFLCMLEIVLRDIPGLIAGCGCGLLLEAIATPFLIRGCEANGASFGLIAASLAALAILLSRMLILLHRAERTE